jgi:hypothetical protein
MTPGKSTVDAGHTSSPNACLDQCTNYSKNTTLTAETGKCSGVVWVIQAPYDNGLCGLKGSRETVAIPNGRKMVAGVLAE